MTTSDPNKIVDQKVIDVLVTGKMERSTLPDYGAGAQQLLFESIDELVMQDFKTDAGMELTSRVSGLGLVDLKITQDLQDTTANVWVAIRTPMSTIRTVTFQMSAGALTEESDI